jgi:hypothetical protein
MAQASTSTASRAERLRTQIVALLLTIHNCIAQVHNDTVAGLSEFFGIEVDRHRATVGPRLASSMGIMQAVKMIGGAVVGIAVIVLVVNQILTVDAIANTTGPFTDVINSLETTGVAAMVLLVVGLLVVAASYIMQYMDSF